MSKKKAKTRLEKATVRHDFSHLGKIVISARNQGPKNQELPSTKEQNRSHLESFIQKDLNFTGILVAVFIALIAFAGIVTYFTSAFNPLFKLIGISY